MDSTNIIQRFYSEIWNAHDVACAGDICSTEMVFRGSLGAESVGLGVFLAYVDSVHASLSEYHCEIEELVTDSDRGFARMRFSGRHTGEFLGFAPSNKILSWSGAALFHLTNGKIRRAWVLGDLYGLHHQLSSNPQQRTEALPD